MNRLIYFLIFALSGCATFQTSNIIINRVPAEVISTSEKILSESPSFRERSYELYRTIEIPPDSYFKLKDMKASANHCTVTFDRDSKKNFQYLADFGFSTGLDKSAQSFGFNTPSLPLKWGCPNGVCEFQSEYVPEPYNMIQIAKIWVDPYFQNVTRMEMEIRKGPKGMAPENMALQLKSTCTPDFIGM